MWGPISIEDGGSVTARKGNNIRKFVREVWDSCKRGRKRKYCERATSRCIPINADVSLGVISAKDGRDEGK
jgi:hypothetical protein